MYRDGLRRRQDEEVRRNNKNSLLHRSDLTVVYRFGKEYSEG